MPIRRRLLLAAAPALLMTARARPGHAQRADARMNERAIGNPDAPLTVQEWFSLTCTHCAHFAGTVFPDVKAKLIDTGRIRYVFRDFPLDQLALSAAAVSRALPADRYLPFIDSLFASQDHWAFDRSADPLNELGHQAALAGMSDADFQAVMADTHLRQQILAEQTDGQSRYGIEGTPTFIFGATKVGPIISYDDFAAGVAKGLAAG